MLEYMNVMMNQLAQLLKNQRGYMAIFIALIFQVLFVFFAMVINVGLLVHDKINLQNSVDLAAYYAAGKQAEVLNAIAHSNYQIRQSWKLLSWRVRALGDMAAKGHPFFQAPPPQNSGDPGSLNEMDVKINDDYPVVCTSHSWWKAGDNDNRDQNFCKEGVKQAVVTFPNPPPPVAVFLPINTTIYTLIQRLRTNFARGCEGVGPRNFSQIMRWMGSYKGDIANRTQIVEAYMRSLSQATTDFPDITNQSVQIGSYKTLTKNLTRSNLEGLEFSFYNSMGGQGKWLNKIAVRPEIFYLDADSPGGSCTPVPRPCSVPPKYSDNKDRDERMAQQICGEPANVSDPFQSTVGYEKNPWVMAYIGIEAKVKGRRPFAPFGEPIELTARAYAKPFGGRIGPWFRTEWMPSFDFSGSGDFIDKLLPFARLADGGNTPDGRDRKNVSTPNYSRFPGDVLGLRSRLSLSLIRRSFISSPDRQLEEGFWGSLPYAAFDDPSADVMAWETTGTPPVPRPPSGYNGPWIRSFEVAAILPDAFDVMYYSIDPFFYQTYIEAVNSNIFGSLVMPRPDLGYRKGSTTFDKMNVFTQITQFQNRYDVGATYIVRRPEQLLTSWAPNQVAEGEMGQYDYNFPDSVYAKCPPPGDMKSSRGIPGGCGYGGRTGYSVKLISESYLRDEKAGIGGVGIRGPIRNPPPEELPVVQ